MTRYNGHRGVVYGYGPMHLEVLPWAELSAPDDSGEMWTCVTSARDDFSWNRPFLQAEVSAAPSAPRLPRGIHPVGCQCDACLGLRGEMLHGSECQCVRCAPLGDTFARALPVEPVPLRTRRSIRHEQRTAEELAAQHAELLSGAAAKKR